MTDCPEQLTFDFHWRQAVVADFDGGLISSDAGLLPLRSLTSVSAGRPPWPTCSGTRDRPARLITGLGLAERTLPTRRRGMPVMR